MPVVYEARIVAPMTLGDWANISMSKHLMHFGGTDGVKWAEREVETWESIDPAVGTRRTAAVEAMLRRGEEKLPEGAVRLVLWAPPYDDPATVTLFLDDLGEEAATTSGIEHAAPSRWVIRVAGLHHEIRAELTGSTDAPGLEASVETMLGRILLREQKVGFFKAVLQFVDGIVPRGPYG